MEQRDEGYLPPEPPGPEPEVGGGGQQQAQGVRPAHRGERAGQHDGVEDQGHHDGHAYAVGVAQGEDQQRAGDQGETHAADRQR